MANKSLTIKEVEKLRDTLNSTILSAIQEFENATGIKVGYISTDREKDIAQEDKGCGCCAPSISYDSDRGKVARVKCNLDMELD